MALHCVWFVPAFSFRKRVGFGWGMYYWFALINCFLKMMVSWGTVTMLHTFRPGSSNREGLVTRYITDFFLRLSTKLRVYHLKAINIETFIIITAILTQNAFWNFLELFSESTLHFFDWRPHLLWDISFMETTQSHSEPRILNVMCWSIYIIWFMVIKLRPKINKHVNYFWS